MSRIIGIDLGTTNSCVSVYRDGKAEVIPNSEGSRTTPSVIAFANGPFLVGAEAKRQAAINVKNTVHASKRLIGRKFSDKEVKEMKKICGYEIVEANNGDAWIQIGSEKKSPSECGAKILMKLKKQAEDYLGKPVTEAIITVPAYFNDSQRQATKDAGTIAGLSVKRVINEPTAAALAYGSDKKGSQVIGVFDLGGGTFDITVLEIGEGVVEVKSTNGDTFLGGEDFDNAIIDHITKEFKSSSGFDLTSDPAAMQRIREEAEKAKIALSSSLEYNINIPYISVDKSGPLHLSMSITRSKFESLVEDIIKKLEEPCKKALSDADCSKLDEVILVGGMTRMPKVQEKVKEIFCIESNKGINPDEAVAIGAAIQGGILEGDVKDILLLDVTPLSLGIEVQHGAMATLIKRNTTIPTSYSQVFSTAADNQDSVDIKVCQGERPIARDNKFLGKFTLTGIPPAPRGVPQIEITFDINADGILEVSAMDKATSKKQNIKITSSSGLTKEEIEKMVQESEKNKDEDEKRAELAKAKNELDAFIYSTKKALSEHGSKVSDDVKSKVESAISDAEKLISSEDASEIRQKLSEFQAIASKIGEAMYSSENKSSNSGDQSSDQNSSSEEKKKDEEDVVDAEATKDNK